MNEKADIMIKDIRAVAYYRALIISKGFLSSVLLIIGLYLGLRRFPVSPLYILLFLNALPPILSYAAIDYSKKSQNKILQTMVKDNDFLLGTLKKKYNYSKLRYISNSASYLISLILIALWQFNYSQSHYLPEHLRLIPIQLLFVTILMRIMGNVFYSLKFRYDLAHNKVC